MDDEDRKPDELHFRGSFEGGFAFTIDSKDGFCWHNFPVESVSQTILNRYSNTKWDLVGPEERAKQKDLVKKLTKLENTLNDIFTFHKPFTSEKNELVEKTISEVIDYLERNDE